MATRADPTSVALLIAPTGEGTSLSGARQQFQEQIDFFRGKLNLPSERWDEIKQAAHDRAFMVAGAQKADLLNDLRAAVDKSLTGGSIGDFRKDFRAAVKKSGWSGWTGEGTKAGEAWRTRVIYQTNMATSYAAGRWKQLHDPELLKVRPFFQYNHADGVFNPRPIHLSWDGLTLRNDHPFWLTHSCPNGWGCSCYITSKRAPAAGASTQPPAGWDAIDPKTGAPVGIDKGWAYAPGANTDTSLRTMVQDKLIGYPDAITKALTVDVNRYINATEKAGKFAARMLSERANVPPLWVGFVENPQAVTALVGRDVKGYTLLIPSDVPRHVETSHAFDGGTQRAPVPADFDRVAEVLNEADSIKLGDLSRNDNPRVVASKLIDGELLTAVFEVLSGKKSTRSLSLVTLFIKTAK